MRRCLFVDDEPLIPSSIRRLLRAEPYECVFAEHPHAALVACRAGPFDVVVSDFRMPEMNGVELLREVRVLLPESVRLLLTGQSCPIATVAALRDGTLHDVLLKPFERETLAGAIRAALSGELQQQVRSHP